VTILRQEWGARVGEGALSGALATAAMSLFMAAARRAHWLGTPPPKKLTDRLLSGIGLPARSHHRWAMTAVNHLAFGAVAGMPFAFLSRRLESQVARLAAGGLYGVAVWAAMYQGVLPALGLMPEPRSDRPGRPTSMAIAHLIYGGALGLLDRRARMATRDESS
jgi:uncharacterized membrane protein YagU involved in acid resistance